jgi:hypothetical protein
MSVLTDRSIAARVTTSLMMTLVGAGAGFTLGLLAAFVVTTVLAPHTSTDGEGWGVLIVWITLAFGGAVVGALAGLVAGYRRRPLPPAPPRPDAQEETSAS